MLKQLFLDVIKKRKEKMDYIYDWTTNSDLQRRKDSKKKDNSENESENEKNNNKKEKEKDIDSNNNDQIDRINSRKLKRDITQEKYDKVESVCCLMYVYKLYNFNYIYRF
jgi:hypothetical protein